MSLFYLSWWWVRSYWGNWERWKCWDHLRCRRGDGQGGSGLDCSREFVRQYLWYRLCLWRPSRNDNRNESFWGTLLIWVNRLSTLKEELMWWSLSREPFHFHCTTNSCSRCVAALCWNYHCWSRRRDLQVLRWEFSGRRHLSECLW